MNEPELIPALPPAPASVAESRPAVIEPCWNQTGVYGDKTCPQLRGCVHCRNCAVFSAAGARLLDRPLPAAYRAQWTARFTAEKKRPEGRRSSAVLFRVAAEWLALPTACFLEIAERRQIHSLPHRGGGPVLGLVNIRGELLMALSLSAVLGLEPPVSAAQLRARYHRLLVTHWSGSRFCFPVDEVHGPHRFHLDQLQPLPATLARARSSFTHGLLAWQNRTVGFLQADLLFSILNRCLA